MCRQTMAAAMKWCCKNSAASEGFCSRRRARVEDLCELGCAESIRRGEAFLAANQRMRTELRRVSEIAADHAKQHARSRYALPGSVGWGGMNPARLQSPDWTILGGGLVLDALEPPPRDGAVAISQDRTIGVNGGDSWNRSKLSEIGWRAAGMRSAGRCDICDRCFGVQQERRILP
ncbi:hypothetical protein Rpal_2565 [Rhodopseudomonas palustris TIE-1]|nr:hypothetical protein Rpal_2565 [Rhodopseudomonas palustris TIE-1]